MDDNLNDGDIEITVIDGNGSEPEKPPKKGLPVWARIVIGFFIVAALLALAAFIFVTCTVDKYAGKVNYTHDPYDPFDTSEIIIDSLPPDYYGETQTPEQTELPTPNTPGPGETPTAVPESTVVPTQPATPTPVPTTDVEPSAPLLMSDKVFNILIIGADTRDLKSFRGNSDVMMLVSFNSATRKIWLTSFHRDMYVQISGVGYNKLNSAYAYAGAKLLQKTLQEDFLVVAPYYVIINFDSFTNVIDALGGIEITLTAEEANGRTVPGITEPGTYLLNGSQALGYARERHLSDDDFGRNQRHRKVVAAVIKKFKSQSITELMSTMDVLLPLLTTNIPKDEIKSLIYKAPEYSKYGVNELSIPIAGTFYYDYYPRVTHVVIVKSMWKNIVAIRDKVYEGAI